MKNYQTISLEHAYRLINPGPVALVATASPAGEANIAPIAWLCPVKKNPPYLAIGVGRSHVTYENIVATKRYIVCLPHISHIPLVRQTGSCSRSEVDKFTAFHIDSFPGTRVPAKIPFGVVGYLECFVEDIIETAGVALCVAQCVHAACLENCFDGRLLVERPEAKIIYHLGSGVFTSPADSIDKPHHEQ